MSPRATLCTLSVSAALISAPTVHRTASAAGCLVPSQPIGQVGGPTTAFALADGHAYIGIGASLRVVDLRAVPSELPSEAVELAEVMSISLPEAAERLVVAGTTLFAALGRSGLRAYDLQDPASPREIGRLDFDGAAVEAMAVSDDQQPTAAKLVAAFHTLGNASGGLAVRDGLAYIGSQEGLRAIDFGNPSAPRDVGGAMLPDAPEHVLLSGPRAYRAGGFLVTGSASIVDVADPGLPEHLATVRTRGFPFSLAVIEPFLLVPSVFSDLPSRDPGDSAALRVFDVRDPV